MLTQAPRGTRDLLPTESYRWQYIEARMREAAALAGYREVRTPVFEHTELFARGVGDTTDIVQKEMYTFQDKGKRSVTLKPEGTAGAARCFLESNLLPRFSDMKRLRAGASASITSSAWNASGLRTRRRMPS